MRCELLADGVGVCDGAPLSRSRLVELSGPSDTFSADGNRFAVEATYLLDKFHGDPDDPLTPDAPQSCLLVTQRYEFHKEGLDPVEPLDSFTAARFKPMIEYKYFGDGVGLFNLETPQRMHFDVVEPLPNPQPLTNSSVFFEDCEEEILGCFITVDLDPSGGPHTPAFHIVRAHARQNPLQKETTVRVVEKGMKVPVPQPAGGTLPSLDNYHQSSLLQVDEPDLNPGCPDCVHMHWRWAGFLTPGKLLAPFPFEKRISERFEENDGNPFVAPSSDHDIDLSLVKFNLGEDDPLDYRDLDDNESTSPKLRSVAPQGNVFWYATTGHRPFEKFMVHGGFFSSLGSLPAISGLEASPRIVLGGVDINFKISNVLGHVVDWTATVSGGVGGSLSSTSGSVTGDPGTTSAVSIALTTLESSTVTVTIRAMDTANGFMTEQSLEVEVTP